MKARPLFALLVLVLVVLGFSLWRGARERGPRGVDIALVDRDSESRGEVAELEALEGSETGDPVAREAALVAGAPSGVPSLAAPPAGEAAIDVEVVARETGEPLVGVKLYLDPEDEALVYDSDERETDEHGRATLLAPAQHVFQLSTRSHVGAEASRREVRTPAAGERVAVRIELRARSDQSWFGRVVDAETGAPLAGATARFVGDNDAPVAADANGLLALESRSWESVAVRVEHTGHAWSLIDTRPEHSTPEKAAVIRLARSARLLVRVERVGGPVAGLEVRVHTDEYWMRQRGPTTWWSSSTADPIWRAQVDASGLATIEGLPPDVPLTVDVHASERLERLPELSLEAGEEREVVVRIGSGCQVLGTALEENGTPAEGLVIWLVAGRSSPRVDGHYFRPYEAKTLAERTRVDAAGRFAFEDVAPGSWLVGPAPAELAEPMGAAPVASVLEISAEDLQKEVTLEIHRGLTIRGRIVGPGGEPVLRAYVMDRRGRFSCNTRDGTFTLGPLAPGEYELTASGGDFARSIPVKVQAGDQDVVIRVRTGGSLVIVTRGPDGATVSAKVSLIPEEPEAAGFSASSTSPDADGSYEFDGLVPGVYHVTASDSFGNFGVLRSLVVRADDEFEERVVTLSPGASVRVLVTGVPEGAALFPRILQEGVPVGFGALDTPIAVFPGTVTIELQAYDPVAEEIVVLETREETAIVGEELEVVFDRNEGD